MNSPRESEPQLSPQERSHQRLTEFFLNLPENSEFIAILEQYAQTRRLTIPSILIRTPQLTTLSADVAEIFKVPDPDSEKQTYEFNFDARYERKTGQDTSVLLSFTSPNGLERVDLASYGNLRSYDARTGAGNRTGVTIPYGKTLKGLLAIGEVDMNAHLQPHHILEVLEFMGSAFDNIAHTYRFTAQIQQKPSKEVYGSITYTTQETAADSEVIVTIDRVTRLTELDADEHYSLQLRYSQLRETPLVRKNVTAPCQPSIEHLFQASESGKMKTIVMTRELQEIMRQTVSETLGIPIKYLSDPQPL